MSRKSLIALAAMMAAVGNYSKYDTNLEKAPTSYDYYRSMTRKQKAKARRNKR